MFVLGEATESWYDVKAKFIRYWTSLKGKIKEILALGPTIKENERRYKTILSKSKSKDVKAKAQDGIKRSQEQYTLWEKVKGKINKYLPSWQKAETESETVSGLGVIPIILGAVALAALAYVATYGLRLLKDASTERRIIADLEKGLITTAQAKELMPKPASLISLGGGASSLLLLLLLGVGGYIYMRVRKS